MRIVTRLHEEHPHLTYDVTIKVEHLRRYPELVPRLAATGCVLITSAVESVDDAILARLDKRHTVKDLERIISLLREARVALNPTLVAFTPWTTLTGFVQLLQTVLRLQLVDHVAPVQYSIRLLIPAGSRLLELPDVRDLVDRFDPSALAYPWVNPDPRVDELHQQVVALVQDSQGRGLGRRETFRRLWEAAYYALDGSVPTYSTDGLAKFRPAPFLTENWYCCAEPTDDQLAGI